MKRTKPTLVVSTDSKIEIEKDVPIIGLNKIVKYPFATMEVGDSFFVADHTAAKLVSAARSHIITRKVNKKFTARTVAGGARIWRVR